jgi:Tfp pilus assembly protein PilF
MEKPVDRILLLQLLCLAIATSQAADPAYADLDRAYQALRAKQYDAAIESFKQSIEKAPDRPSIHKDLAYTLLKIGESEAARDEFAIAMRLDPGDEPVAMEYAFLCYETKQEVVARRVFQRLRTSNTTAAEAFENIDRPLREGIDRWRQALAAQPDDFSGHRELAALAEQRDDLTLSAEHYEAAWRLRPERRELLLDLARVWRQQGRTEDAAAALLAASRSTEPRLAEQARELLPARYPYVSEFEAALALDPTNIELRRELAFLQLQLQQTAAAEEQFAHVIERAPGDRLAAAQLGLLRMQHGDDAGAMTLLNQVLAGSNDELASRVRSALRLPGTLDTQLKDTRAAAAATGGTPSKELGFKSLEKGYLKDALKYLTAAYEDDDTDYDVMLKLGWANNLLKNDPEAVKWFKRARLSPDRQIAAESEKAYRNLEPSVERFRTTIWVFPTFSTRWHDLFAYAQAKTELRLRNWWARPYVSARFVGDSAGAVSPGSGWAPQYLSENAVILAAGIATQSWHGATFWFEAGEQLPYRRSASEIATNTGRSSPDDRGGASFARGLGHLLSPGAHGLYGETNDDVVYVRRFQNDTLLYSQNRAGYTLRQPEARLGSVHAQAYWNWNVTTDVKGLYWANTIETGPGVRFQFPGLPFLFSINALRGKYLVNTGNPRGPVFNDLRIGVWYAFTR